MKSTSLKIGQKVQFKAGGFSHFGIVVDIKNKDYCVVEKENETKWPVKTSNIQKVFKMTFETEQIKYTAQDLATSLKTFDEQLAKFHRNCVECDSFVKSTYHCTVYDAQVPAETIVVGCDSFTNLVPF